MAAGRGERVALAAGDAAVTYRALQHRVAARARALERAKLQPGDRVVLRCANAIPLAETWLALQRVGATAVITHAMLRPREIARIVCDADARMCLAGADVLGEMAVACETHGVPPPAVVETDGFSNLGPPPAIDGSPGHALIAYTHGVAAVPHGCAHSAAAVAAAAEAYGAHVLGLTEGDVAGGAVPLAFTYGLGALLVMPLQAGACAVLEPRFDANDLLESIQRRRVTVLFGTATAYRLLLKIPDLERRGNHRSLRLCVSAGEPLEADVAQEWRARTGVELIDSLGSTEMFHVSVSQRPGGAQPGTIGSAVPGYEIRVESSPGIEAADGQSGRLLVRGPTACTFWRRPDLQRLGVRDGWHVTGDLVRRAAGGAITFDRRADDLIVSAGYNVSGAEIEDVLAAHPDVAQARVTGVPDPVRGKVVRASIVLAPQADRRGAIARLQEHAARELSPYKWPRRWEIS